MAPHHQIELTPEEEWRLTCHEAGHVVLGVRYQINFLHVEIDDSGNGDMPIGVGPIENPDGAWSEDEISRWQQFYAAGAAAEHKLFGAYQEHGASRDRHLHEVLERQRRADRRGGWESDIQAAAIVLDRESVEKVARELGRRRKLSDEQVYELLVP